MYLNRDKKKIEYFNEKADCWDDGEWPEDEEQRLKDIFLKSGISVGKFILELGCGTGRTTGLILELMAGTDVRIIGIDFADKMLEIANKKKKSPWINYVLGDAKLPPFKDGSFDVVLMYNVFPHLSYPEESLRALYRIISSSGILVICHLEGSAGLNAFHSSLDGVVQEDLIPPENVMKSMINKSGFTIENFVDRNDLYWIVCTKK